MSLNILTNGKPEHLVLIELVQPQLASAAKNSNLSNTWVLILSFFTAKLLANAKFVLVGRNIASAVLL